MDINGGNFFAAASSDHHHQQAPNRISYHGISSTTFSNNNAMEQAVDPHLVSLQLGKRDYYVENGESSSSVVGKKGRQTTVARCQVEECGAELRDAKEYYRRHKVCEVHAKATSVVLHGLHQRFCQQCSRFHRVNEFDEAKRSCRRRLAGHNERRRKSPHVSLPTNAASQGRFRTLHAFLTFEVHGSIVLVYAITGLEIVNWIRVAMVGAEY
ncbi:Squamosa promoter-binding protein 1-like protein [Drosera capensis]